MYDYYKKSLRMFLSVFAVSMEFSDQIVTCFIHELIKACQISTRYTDTVDINTNSCRVIYIVSDQLFEVSTKLWQQMINEDLNKFLCQIF